MLPDNAGQWIDRAGQVRRASANPEDLEQELRRFGAKPEDVERWRSFVEHYVDLPDERVRLPQ